MAALMSRCIRSLRGVMHLGDNKDETIARAEQLLLEPAHLIDCCVEQCRHCEHWRESHLEQRHEFAPGDCDCRVTELVRDLVALLRVSEREDTGIRSQRFTQRGRCQWHDTEFLAWTKPNVFYCALCEDDARRLGNTVAEPARIPPPTGGSPK